MRSAYLAIDLGASSGRAIVGVLSGEPLTLEIEEVHRFEHHSCPTPTGPVWDLTGIWRNILVGLRNAASWAKGNDCQLQSVGVDTWGVDWTLVTKQGELLSLPHCYRDPQNEPACERVLERLGGFENLYRRTGIQLLPFNTLFQVAARYEANPGLFDSADRLLFLPDLFHYWLSGKMKTERSIASTSAMLDVKSGDWDRELLGQLGLPTHMLGPIVDPGTRIGSLRAELARSAGLSNEVQVIAPAAHDTASAVAAVPAISSSLNSVSDQSTKEERPQSNWAYLSSGTWSLLGAELTAPLATTEAASVPFTNERGVQNTVRLLKNISGLWLIQELRRELTEVGLSVTFSELAELAGKAEPFRTLVDPNDAPFASPGDLIAKLRRFALRTNQPEPESTGQLARCCLESLALSYRYTWDQLEQLLGREFDRLHLIGGGSKNELLNQFTANALGHPVLCGPVEATAIGNLLVQAMGVGAVQDLGQLRQIVSHSFEVEYFSPDISQPNWNAAQNRFVEEILPVAD